MTPVDVYILGDVTFLGRVVASEYFVGTHWFPAVPVEGNKIWLDNSTGGRSEFWGSYNVCDSKTGSFSGFSDPHFAVRLRPLKDSIE